MKEQERKPLRGIFPRLSPPDERKEEENEPRNEQQYYAIASEQEVPIRFKLFQASNKKYSIPYALLPICIQPDSAMIYIKAYELLISISGRNLDPIEEHLTNQTLKWVRASKSGKDDGSSETFVRDITVEGQAVDIQGGT